MDERQTKRLTGRELHALFDQLFPHGFAGADVRAELESQQRRGEVERFQAELREANARAREEAMDRPPPATVRAYRAVYGRDPRGWPPA